MLTYLPNAKTTNWGGVVVVVVVVVVVIAVPYTAISEMQSFTVFPFSSLTYLTEPEVVPPKVIGLEVSESLPV